MNFARKLEKKRGLLEEGYFSLANEYYMKEDTTGKVAICDGKF